MKTKHIGWVLPALALVLAASCSSLPKEAPQSVTDPAVLRTFDKAIYGADIPSLLTLASYYKSGSQGFPKSHSSYIACLQKAAEAGDLNTQRELGLDYLYGRNGCFQNDKKAAKWLSMAAAQGDSTARKGMSLIQSTAQLDEYEDEMIKAGRKQNYDIGREMGRMSF